jgi:hypothetical protein
MAICSLIRVWVRIKFYIAHTGLDLIPQLINAVVKFCIFVVEQFDQMGNGFVEILLFFVCESDLKGLLVESEDLFKVFDIVFEELVLFFEEIEQFVALLVHNLGNWEIREKFKIIKGI